MMRQGYLKDKHQNGHNSKDKHYWISQKGLDVLKTTNFFEMSGYIDTTKVHFRRK